MFGRGGSDWGQIILAISNCRQLIVRTWFELRRIAIGDTIVRMRHPRTFGVARSTTNEGRARAETL